MYRRNEAMLLKDSALGRRRQAQACEQVLASGKDEVWIAGNLFGQPRISHGKLRLDI
jgi:hypothetical protein